MPRLSIVSPIYREGSLIPAFLDAVEAALAETGETYEILLVDDGSPDDSWEYLRTAAKERAGVTALRLSRNFGKEAALAAGLDAATGDAVITLDSDLQHPPALIPAMVDLWRKGEAKIVEARKENRQKESRLDRTLANLFYKLFDYTTSFDLEGASDFKLLDRSVVNAWKELPERRVFFRGMAHWVGFSRAQILFTPADRAEGGTKWSFAKKFTLALDSMTAFTARPLSLIWLLGILFFFFSLVVGAEALVTKLRGDAVDGFTTVILLILITGSAVLAAICILSVYIRQIFHEVKRRPRYLIGDRALPSRRGKTSDIQVRPQRKRTANKDDA